MNLIPKLESLHKTHHGVSLSTEVVDVGAFIIELMFFLKHDIEGLQWVWSYYHICLLRCWWKCHLGFNFFSPSSNNIFLFFPYYVPLLSTLSSFVLWKSILSSMSQSLIVRIPYEVTSSQNSKWHQLEIKCILFFCLFLFISLFYFFLFTK